jgi:hypothetical protein
MKKLYLILVCGMAIVGGCKEFDPTAYDNIEIQCASKTMDYNQKVVAVKKDARLCVAFYDLEASPSLQFKAEYPIEGQFAKRFFKRLNPESMIKMSDSTQMELTGGKYSYSVKLGGDETSFTLYAPCSLEIVLIAPKPMTLMSNTDKLFEELQNEASRKNPNHDDNTPSP